MAYSISVTSRPRTDVERDGWDYHFVAGDEFDRRIQRSDFIEWTEYRGAYYGTPQRPLEEFLKEGLIVLLALDVNGARSLKKVYKDCVTIYILGPSMMDLEERLKKRARDSRMEIQARLAVAGEEMKCLGEYDYAFVNVDFDASIQRLHDIIEAEKCRVTRILR
jgi:guanylate kinase